MQTHGPPNAKRAACSEAARCYLIGSKWVAAMGRRPRKRSPHDGIAFHRAFHRAFVPASNEQNSDHEGIKYQM